MNLVDLILRLRLKVDRNLVARWLNSNALHERMHRKGWEPEVLSCLCETRWDGPVWDVGAHLGRLAYRVAPRHRVYAFEPNLNTLQFLGYNLRNTDNVIIVPCALTLDGRTMLGSFDPDFTAPPTGPQVATISLAEALRKFGRPGVIKLDIEGGEYELIQSELLVGLTLLVEWHKEVPRELPHWTIQNLDGMHTLLRPKSP